MDEHLTVADLDLHHFQKKAKNSQTFSLSGTNQPVCNYNPCLVLVQPRKTRPDITEKLLTGT